jgi:hypothetical protein
VSDRGSGRTHCLFVEAIQPQARGRGRLLRPRADLVDRVERMAENAICSRSASIADSRDRGRLPAVTGGAVVGVDIPTESDITSSGYARPPAQVASTQVVVLAVTTTSATGWQRNSALGHTAETVQRDANGLHDA